MRTQLLAPGFLIASPRLDGSLFERAVIVMIHHDQEGAMGFMVNKPMDVDFGSLLEMVEMDRDTIAPVCYNREVFFGGPVRIGQLWIIFNDETGAPEVVDGIDALERDGEVRFHDNWALSGTTHTIQSFAVGEDSSRFRPFVGYAGWGPGQLEIEVENGSWLMVDFEDGLQLDHDPATLWDDMLSKIGIDETAFLMMGKAGNA